jgi:hypothetical protein
MSSTEAMILALQHFEEAKISYLAKETDSTQAILDCCELAPHMIEDYTGWLIMSHH